LQVAGHHVGDVVVIVDFDVDAIGLLEVLVVVVQLEATTGGCCGAAG
jgi:hypothetical protein